MLMLNERYFDSDFDQININHVNVTILLDKVKHSAYKI